LTPPIKHKLMLITFLICLPIGHGSDLKRVMERAFGGVKPEMQALLRQP